MIQLISILKFLRPNAEWTLNGDTYEGLNWMDLVQTKPTEEEIEEAHAQLLIQEAFNASKQSKMDELDTAYTAAQHVKVVYDSNTFLIPVIGEFFTSTVANQVLEAQISGSASLIAKDIDGNSHLIKDVPFVHWKKFYKDAKIIAFDNIVIKNRVVFQISAATTVDDLKVIDVNVFPEVPFIRL